MNTAIPSEGTPAFWAEGFVCLSEAADYAGDIAGALLMKKLSWIKPDTVTSLQHRQKEAQHNWT
jgi:hypothetical protein